MKAVVRVRSLPRLLPALALTALAVLAVLAAPAQRPAAAADTPAVAARAVADPVAAASVSEIGRALRASPLYIDPAAVGQLSAAEGDALVRRIRSADKPLFLVVLPAGYPTAKLFTDLRTATGVTGLYAIRLGDRFDARADSSVLPRTAVRNLVTSVQGEPAAAQLGDFTDRALADMGGSAPASWGGTGGGGPSATALITAGAVVVAGGAGAYVLVRRNRQRRQQEQRAALEQLRVVVDEDITAFGEELDRLDFHPAEAGADDAMRADYERGLDAYEQAKQYMAQAARPEDVRAVTQALENGRFSLAQLAARRSGQPLPERRPPCFFDPRHGPSVADAEWTPPGGTARRVPVCAADGARLADGREPMAREVDTAAGRRPYWDAGPAYGPWAGGYFGGGLLPGLLVGTLLGGMMANPGYAAGYGSGYGDFGAAGYEGGDVSGADFDTGDFGDFGGGFGDGGGGDFGGGGGDFGGGF
ncbi:hypothetical protein [Streptomyces sp. NPDC047000]|uniref:hypothetical protein n=1 Tax=Streptomyces sp. NPDC047000 TaxID=3155474 RepID=UPI0034047A90